MWGYGAAGCSLNRVKVVEGRRPKSLPPTRIGKTPPYGMIGGIEETSASFEARSAPRSYPTRGAGLCYPPLSEDPPRLFSARPHRGPKVRLHAAPAAGLL